MITRIETSFVVNRPPEAVFDYVADPTNAPEWQTSGITVELLTEGPIQTGTRIRERGKALGLIPVEQITEITGFDRPSYIEVTTLEGPVMPVRGSYRLEPDGVGTCVRVECEYGSAGLLRRVLVPVTRRMIARRLARHNRKLTRILEAV